MPDTIRLAEVPDPHFTTWRERAVVVLLAMMTAAGVAGYFVLQDLNEGVVENRTLNCEIKVRLGIELRPNDPCSELERAGKFDPETAKGP